MKKSLATVSTLAVTAALVAGLTGCVTVNVQKPGNDNDNANTEQSANSANAENSEASANSNAGKDSNASANANKNSNANTAPSGNSNTSKPSDDFSTSFSSAYPAPKDATQKVGNSKTGYIMVPEDWMDRTTQDIDEHKLDATAATYVVDPTTEFTSGVLMHFAFSSSILMETYNTDFASKAKEIIAKYDKDTDNYSNCERHNYTLNGKNASVIKYDTADGVDVYFVTLDTGEHSCTMFTVYALPSQAEHIVGYLNTWGE